MSQASSTPTSCPNCGAPSTGKFCAECGAALMGAKCASCQSLLTPGARFCHRCGSTVGAAAGASPVPAAAARGERSIVPWIVAGAALLAVVIMVAAQQGQTPPPAQDGALPLGAEAPFAGGGGAVRAPDISNMSPRERADRLYNRVMNMAAAGKTDSAAFFASMAVGAYESLTPLDTDLRYDYGRMAELAGALPLAQAQADTILREQPDHLLGLILSARVAMARGDKARGDQLLAQLARVQQVELAKSLEEYQRHKGDIDAALAEAGKK